MRDKRAIFTGISVFGIILAIGLLVNGALGISGFEGVYEDSLVSRYNIDGKYIKTRVESSLNLGKKLYLLENTVKPLFSETLESSSGIDHIYIIDENNKILYSTRNTTAQQYIPFNYYEGQKTPSEDLSPYTYKFLDTNFVCIPLFTGNTDYTGSVLIEYSQKSVSSYISPYVDYSVKLGGIVLAIAFVLFAIGNMIFGDNYKFENISTIVLLIISQLAFSMFNFRQYNTALGNVFNANMLRLGNSVTSAIEEPIRLTDSLYNLKDVNSYLKGRISGNEQCSSIYILDSNNNNVYFKAFNQPDDEDAYLDLLSSDVTVLPIYGDADEAPRYKLALKINRPLINSILRDMALDSGTIIIVALIFAFILKSFIIFLRYKKDILVPPEEMTKGQERTVLRVIEISTFVFMFAAYETLSFIPLYIQEIIRTSAVTIPGLAAETLESLPVSTYMIGIMIAMFITLFGMKNLSVKKRYTIMSFIFIAGSVLTIFSHDIILFAISRFICGFGFGGVLLSTSSLVMKYTSVRTRSAGFGTNAAAFASASITSIPVGGVIVNKFGYEAGIMVSIAFAFAFLVFSSICLPEEKKQVVKVEEKKTGNISIKDFFRVFASRHILTYILFINIPFQIIYWGLFQFLLPIYMSDTLKLSQGNIGRILGIFSIVSLFAASVSCLADKAKNDKLLIGLGAICAGAAMFVFGFYAGGFILFLVIMIAMGVDNLFIDSIEEVYLESGHVKNVSEENLLQSYKVIEKILSVFIPSVTTLIIITTGFNFSMQIIGAYSAIGAILFIIFGKNGRWSKKNEK